MYGFRCELDHGTWLDITPRADVMREASCGRTQGLTFAIVVGVNDDDRLLGTHIDNELPCLGLLSGCQAQLGGRIGSHRSIDMKPGVHHSHLDQPINPFFGKQIIIGLAKTRADPGHYFVFKTVLQTLHGLAQHIQTASPLITDDFVSLNTNQRCNVSHTSQALRNFLRNKVPVCEHLEVAIRMTFEEFQHLRVHERLSPQDAKK